MARNRQALIEAMIGRFGRERWNEHVKLAATTLNSVGIAGLIGAFVAPLVNPEPPEPLSVLLLLGAGMLLHVAAAAGSTLLSRQGVIAWTHTFKPP